MKGYKGGRLGSNQLPTCPGKSCSTRRDVLARNRQTQNTCIRARGLNQRLNQERFRDIKPELSTCKSKQTEAALLTLIS